MPGYDEFHFIHKILKIILVKNEDPQGIPRGVVEEFFYEELNSSQFIPRGNNFRGVGFLEEFPQKYSFLSSKI